MFLSKTEVKAIFQEEFAAAFSEEFKTALKAEIVESLKGDGSVSVEDALRQIDEKVDQQVEAIQSRINEFAGAPGASIKNPIPEVDPLKNTKSDLDTLNDFLKTNAGNPAACIEATNKYYENLK